MDTTISKPAARAQALRIEAGHSMIDTATAVGVPAIEVLRMERGHEGRLELARRVIGHYMGSRNERELKCPVGRRLRALRKAAGDTQEALAVKLGIAPAYVSTIERNPLRTSKKTARRIAEHYGVSGAELIGGKA